MKNKILLIGSFLVLAIMVAAVAAQAQTTAFETAKLLASDGAEGDFFGASVSISGDTLIVGAWRDDLKGSAYIFVRDGNGAWNQEAKLTASDGAAWDFFGWPVSISEDTAIVGAYGDDDNGVNSGSAYIFVRDGMTWTQQAKLTASDAATNDQFGISVAISGGKAIVGADRDDIGSNVDQGSAYIFVRDGNGVWNQEAKLITSDGAAGDTFGLSVSISEESAIVGARYDDDVGDDSGSAYIFVRDGNGIWTPQAKLTASDGAAGAWFGFLVSISGDMVIAGASGDDDRKGSAYVFVRDGNGVWNQEAKLTASDGVANDRFGISVSISGDTAIVSARYDDNIGQDSGSAYIFVRNETGWEEQVKLLASDSATKDLFGWSVTISGKTAIVGAYGDDDNGDFSGSAYIFVIPPTIPQMLQNLASKVVQLNINRGISNSWDAKLDAALHALDDANDQNDVASVNALNAFINAVMAQSGSHIDVDEANELIADAEAIIAALGQ